MMTADNSVVDSLMNTMFGSYPDTNVNEIEFSIVGQQAPGSPWNLGISKFRNMLTSLSKQTGIKPVQTIMLTAVVDQDRVRIDDIEEIKKFCVNNSPAINHQNVLFETKTRSANPIDIPEHGLRLRYAYETQIPIEKRSDIVNKLKDRSKTKYYRHAQRYSIISPKRFGQSQGQLRVDFTSVRQAPGFDFRSAQLTGPGSLLHDRYEVEVDLSGFTREEFFSNEAVIREELKFYLGFILRTINGSIAIEPATDKLISLNKYMALCADALKVAGGVAADLSQRTLISLASKFLTVNITTLSMKHIANDADQNTVLLGSGNEQDPAYVPPYVFTDKADGQRSLLFIDDTGKATLITRGTIKPLGIKEGKEFQVNELKQILEVNPTGLKYADSVTNVRNSLLDGEYLWIKGKPYFLVFDLLISEGQNITQTDFVDRIKMFKTRFNINTPGLNVQSKEFYTYTIKQFNSLLKSSPPKFVRKMDQYQLVGLDYNATGGLTYHLDGLVFQPARGPGSYFPLNKATWNTVYKWKPTYMATLDLLLTYDGQAAPPKITKTYETKTVDGTSYSVSYAVFKAQAADTDTRMTTSEYMCCARLVDDIPRTEGEDGELGEPIRKGMIVECRLSVEDVGTGSRHWVPVRVRHDKSKPNHMRVYTDLLNTIIRQPITLENLEVKGGGRGGSALITVNNVNRAISNNVIVNEITSRMPGTSEIRLLDLGSGRLKSGTAWRNLSKLRKITALGVDVIDTSQANIYLQDFMVGLTNFKAEIVHGNFNSDLTVQLPDKLFKPEMFNVVTCTFAIHYAMATEDTFRTFVRNVGRNLQVGGLFIGSYMNKDRIMEDMAKKKPAGVLGGSLQPQSPVLWQIKLANISVKEAEATTFGAGINVTFTELYDAHLEYLISLDDPAVKRIFDEEGLVRKEHRPFNAKPDAAQVSVELERQWLSYHYTFVYEKVSQPAVNPPVKSPPAQEAQPTQAPKRTVKKPTAKKTAAPEPVHAPAITAAPAAPEPVVQVPAPTPAPETVPPVAPASEPEPEAEPAAAKPKPKILFKPKPKA